ncbi:MAG: hypothetical protein GY795_12325 [Desulfobacterales bacterium]|nr:hypothetical protein [Desulfobacterales bacterium]
MNTKERQIFYASQFLPNRTHNEKHKNCHFTAADNSTAAVRDAERNPGNLSYAEMKMIPLENASVIRRLSTRFVKIKNVKHHGSDAENVVYGEYLKPHEFPLPVFQPNGFVKRINNLKQLAEFFIKLDKRGKYDARYNDLWFGGMDPYTF